MSKVTGAISIREGHMPDKTTFSELANCSSFNGFKFFEDLCIVIGSSLVIGPQHGISTPLKIAAKVICLPVLANIRCKAPANERTITLLDLFLDAAK